MKTLITLVLFVSTFSISSQNTNWQPYYFAGINIWDFDSTGWEIKTGGEYEYFEIVDRGTCSLICFDPGMVGYEFTLKEDASFWEYWSILNEDFGDPGVAYDFYHSWIVDVSRTVVFSWGDKQLKVIFMWADGGC